MSTRFRNDDRAVSSVIGVVLMVAVTLVLGSTVLLFVTDMGLSESVCTMEFPPRFQGVFDQIFGQVC